jgi:hypothetical protein
MDAILSHLPLQLFSALPIAAHTSHLSNMPQHAQSAISRGRPSDAQRKAVQSCAVLLHVMSGVTWPICRAP